MAPAQVAEEAALQQALPQALQQALQRQEPTAQPEASPRGAPHCRPFPRLNILILVIQENRKRNTGPTGVNRVAVDIRQLKAQGAQGNGAVEFHEMPFVCAGLHDKAKPRIDDALANDIVAQRPLDIRGGGQGGTAQEEL